MAVPDKTPKIKFNRKYFAFNPNAYAGPKTEVLDTLLKPIPPKEENG